jgi:heptosyltransferase-2
VRGVNWLGDAVMSTPALLRLREARPAAQITLLTQRRLADLWIGHPAVNAVMTFEAGETVWSVARRVRAGRFDVALVLPNSPRSALEVFLARVPRRIGYARAWRTWFLTEALPRRAQEVPMRKRTRAEIIQRLAAPMTPEPELPAEAHHVHQYLHLVAALGGNPAPVPPRLEVSAEEVDAVRRRFDWPDRPAPLFGLNAGAAYGPAKQWPRERFVAAARDIQRRTGCAWWILGGPDERALAEGIAAEVERGGNGRARSLAGATTLRELCAALKACAVVLTNDSGPMHVAAAVGTPVVALFGSTSPALTRPGLPGDRHAVLRVAPPCSPCFLRECPVDFRCMQGLAVEEVVGAVVRLTEGIGPTS